MIPLPLLFACAGEDPLPADTAAPAPTWEADVAPILMGSCVGCHTAGGLAFALDSYAAAGPMAAAVADATSAGRMPPWGAQETDECTPPAPWKDDLRLTAEQIATIRAWADGGAPQGDRASAAPLPSPPELRLTSADQELVPVEGYVASGSEDEFVCFSMDPGRSQTSWIQGIQINAGNAAVVHHALVFLDPERASEGQAGDQGWYPCFGGAGIDNVELVGAWAPGSVPFVPPADSGIRVEAGSRFVVQIHYHPLGEPADEDLTTVSIDWADVEPTYEAQLALVGNFDSEGRPASGELHEDPDDQGEVEFRIPAGASQHTETMSYMLTGLDDSLIRVFMAGTHMHYVGTDMKFWVEHADAEASGEAETCLVQTPAWDFDWQRGYNYDVDILDAPVLRNRDTLWMRCTYDNTLANPGVQRALAEQGLDAPVDVYLGETTLDEMCLGVVGFIVDGG